jgi:hypothetical protein
MDAMDAMDPPAEGVMMDEAAPLMMEEGMEGMEKAPTEKALSEKLEEVVEEEEEHDMCCCCICQCSTKETADLSCCGCFPIKCGIISIGILFILLSIAIFCEIFYCLVNEYIHWWYVLVSVFLLIPLILGTCFFVTFFTKDTEASRGKLYISCMLAIISVSLVGIWNLIYFQWLYKFDVVYAGTDFTGYTMQSKKSFMVWQLFIVFLIDFLFAYFLCVTSAYATRRNGKPQEGLDLGIGLSL